MKIKLDSVLEAIELADDAYEYFLNIETGEVIMIADSIITGIDNEEQINELEENWDIYCKLPTKYDIHEYNIMECFIDDFPEGNVKRTMERAISGKGAFRRFKDNLREFNIEEKWYKYQADVYKNIAISWCRENDLEYEE